MLIEHLETHANEYKFMVYNMNLIHAYMKPIRVSRIEEFGFSE